MSYYLQIGDLILADGSTDTSGYSLTGHPSFPEPDPDGFGGHLPAVREFTVRCTGTTASAAHHKAALLRRECVRDKWLYFRHGLTGDVLSCRIRDAKCSEAEYSPAVRDSFGVIMDVWLKTDPYWLGAWSAETSASGDVTGYCDHFDIADPGGEVDALLTTRCVLSGSATVLALGVRPDPATGYDYADVTGSSLTASATYAAVGSWPTIDTNDNRGRHLLFTRASSSAATGTSYKGRSSVTGNAIATTTTVDEAAVTQTASGLRFYELGDVQIPSGAVPSVDTGTGYGAESSGTGNATASAWLTPSGAVCYQSFPIDAGLHTGVTVNVRNTSASTVTARVYLHRATGDWPDATPLAYGELSVPATSSGEVKATWDIPYAVASSGTYCMALDLISASLSLYYSTASAYALGKLSMPYVSGTPSSSADLQFTSHYQPVLGFNASTPVLAASTSTDLVNVSGAFRVPVDYAAVIYRDTAAALGIYYDADTDTPYGADSDGIASAIYDKCEIRAPLRAKPGVTNRVVVLAANSSGATEGASTLTYKTRPRFLTATG